MVITLRYKYLQHDIDQWTFRLGRMNIEDETARSEAQSSNISTDITFYRRKIVEAIAMLRTLLKKRLSAKVPTSSSDLSTTANEWTITLTDLTYKTDADVLAGLMHQFVIRSVVQEWAQIYVPAAVGNVSAEKEALKDDILKEAFNRVSPTLEDGYVLALHVSPAGAGTVTGAGMVYDGQTMNIHATANAGYRFTGWSDGVADATRSITISVDTSLTANFAAVSS